MAHWMCWAVREFSLEGVPMYQFYMRGKDICGMGKEAFLARAPPVMGDILWEHLEILQKGKNFFFIFRKFTMSNEVEERDAYCVLSVISIALDDILLLCVYPCPRGGPDIRDVTHTESNMVETVNQILKNRALNNSRLDTRLTMIRL